MSGGHCRLKALSQRGCLELGPTGGNLHEARTRQHCFVVVCAVFWSQEAGYEAFLALDKEGKGQLDHSAVVDLARKLAPELRAREVHYLITHLHVSVGWRQGGCVATANSCHDTQWNDPLFSWHRHGHRLRPGFLSYHTYHTYHTAAQV